MRSLRIILILAGKHLRILSRMRAILLVMFLPGIVLYTIFTFIFSGPAGRPFKVAVIDKDDTPESRRLIEMLSTNNVVIIRTENEEDDGVPLTVESARESIRDKGKFRVALVIPEGFGNAPNILAGEEHGGVELHYDKTQGMEANIVKGMVQMAAGRSLFKRFESFLNQDKPPPTTTSAESDEADAPSALVHIHDHSVAIHRMQIAAKHTFLAGILPMFLLFSTTGAARGLLDELKSGEIRRQLAAPIVPAHLLLGQQLSCFVMAIIQCYVLLFYAWLVFGVEIWNIPGGLLAMTIVTSLATTGFGMLMAAICRTGEQLDGIGTVVILAMSAIGGSMVPRWIMPEWMQGLGLFTINGWAYDGYIAIIQNRGFEGIWLKCLVLLLIAAGCATLGSVLLNRRLRSGPEV